MAEENEAETKLITIVATGRRRDVTVGVNGEVKKFPVNTPIGLAEHQREALLNAGYQLVVEGDKSGEGEEGSAPSPDQGPDNNRTEPHQNPDDPQQNDGEVTEGGAGARDENGAPVLVGGDEPDPKVHSVTGDGRTGSTSPLDHDEDGKAGGSKPADPPALTGKTTAELEKIAEDEEVQFGDDVKTNADRIAAIQKAREAKA